MAWPPWPKTNEKGLASYALANSAGRLRLAVARDNLLTHGKRQELLEAIYDALLKRDIRYARELFDPTLEQQQIREPELILQGAGDGTCLDLALLFSGLCLGNELLPLTVVLNDHALTVVSLVRGRREAGAPGRRDPEQDGPWVEDGLLKSGDMLRELVQRGDYLPIECTGFARSDALPRTLPEGKGRVDGKMTFARAVEAGREQLDVASGRKFGFAIDVAMLQDVLKVPPHTLAYPLAAVPAQAPALRPGFVSRPEVLDRLREHLTPGSARIVALHGMAGAGKSIMAASAALDHEILTRFPDGVLWASVGFAPDLTSILSGWIQAFGGVELGFTAPGPARQHLQTMLGARSVLLVLDDVFEAAHATDLVAGGQGCATLITTRDATVARACGAAPEDILPITRMTLAQARALLAGGEGRILSDTFRGVTDEIAAAVGRLPLALRLASAQAADGVPWQEIRDDLSAQVDRLEALDLPGADELPDPQLAKQQSLLASLAISVRRLPEDRRRQLTWLGVFRGRAVISPAAAAILWGTDDRGARDGLRYLHGRALLEAWSGTTYTLHDTIHALTRRLIAAPTAAQPADRVGLSGLGLTLRTAHATLLDHYAATRVHHKWHSLADDGYIQGQLTWHFERAERADELYRLLAETAPGGENAWFAVRERLGQPEGYFEDARRAFALAEAPSRIRYALILASLQSAADVPPALVQALIRAQRWSIPFAMAYARNLSDLSAQVLTLAAVAEVADKRERLELLKEAAAKAAAMEGELDTIVSKLAPRLASDELLTEALTLARRLDDEPLASVLADIAASAPLSERPPIVTEAAEAAAASGHIFRSGALAAVAPLLDEIQVRELLSQCDEIPGETLREAAIAALLPQLGKIGYSDEALARARNLTGPLARARSLAEIAPVVSEPARTEAVREALLLLPEVNQEEWAEKIGREVPHLPPLSRTILVFSLTIRRNIFAEILATLPSDLTSELRTQAVEVVRGLKDSVEAARALSALAPVLTEEERQTTVRWALEEARSNPDAGSRTSALAAILDYLPAAQRAAVACEALEASADQRGAEIDEALRKIGPYLKEADQERALTLAARKTSQNKSEQLSALAPFLLPSLLPRAIAIARSTDDEDAALLVGAAVAPGLDTDSMNALLEWMPQVTNEYVRARAAAAVLPHLEADLLPVARAVIEGIGHPTYLAEVALPALAALLKGGDKDAILERAVALAATIDDPDRLVWAFRAFAQQLSGAQLSTALETLDQTLVSQANFSACRVELLAVAAIHAPQTMRGSLVTRALSLARQLHGEEAVRGLRALAPRLSVEERSEVGTFASQLSNAFERAEVFAALAAAATNPEEADGFAMSAMEEAQKFADSESLSIEEQVQIIGSRALPFVIMSAEAALKLSASLEDSSLSARALVAITHRLAPELVPHAIEIALRLPAQDRSKALLALSEKLTNASRVIVLGQALEAALETNTDLLHDETLAPLAQRLAGLPEAALAPLWQRALLALSNRPRPQALATLHALAPVLLRIDGGDGALECFRAIRDVRQWWP